jgi:hypothetical protein
LNEEFDNKEKKRKSSSDDAEELRAIAEALPELMNVLNDSIPKLISGLIGSVYSPEAAGNMGAAVGKFFRELVDQGIPEDVALDMTKKFVGALDFSKMMSMISSEIDTDVKIKPKPPKPPTPKAPHPEEDDEEYEEE